MSKKEKKENKIVAFDKTGIGICGKFFDVNQDFPSTELLNKMIKSQYMSKEVETQAKNYASMIEAINKKQSEIITNNPDDLIEKFNEFEKQKDLYMEKIENIYTHNLKAIFEIMEWLLGKEAVDLIKSKGIAFNEIINILFEAAKRNNYMRDYLNNAIK